MTRYGSTAVIACAVVLAACGGGSSGVVRPPSDTPPTSTTPASTAPTTPPNVHPSVTIRPARGLDDGQSVQVIASGFSPGEALQVIQCADKGQKTGPGDCNLPGMLAATSDAGGRLTVALTVVRGPFGGNSVVCSAKQECLISVTQASLAPSEEADAPISFARP